MAIYTTIPKIIVNFDRKFANKEEVSYILHEIFENIVDFPPDRNIVFPPKTNSECLRSFGDIHFFHYKNHPDKEDYLEIVIVHKQEVGQDEQSIYCQKRANFNYKRASRVISKFFKNMELLDLEETMNS